MLLKINKAAFFLTITLLLFAIINLFSRFYETNTFWVHPLFIILLLSLMSFILGLFGFGGVENKVSFARSIITTIISLLLLFVLGYVLFIGLLFS